MDCTASMQSWITRTKEILIETIDDTIKKCAEDEGGK